MSKYDQLTTRLQSYFPENECVEWQGQITKHGYGQVRVRDKREYVHRISCRFYHGEAPASEHHVLHSCDNPRCFNPNHLRWGSQRSNLEDMTLRGRSSRGFHRPTSKLNEEQVREIRGMYTRGSKPSQVELASMFGVSQMVISRIVRNTGWRHVTDG